MNIRLARAWHVPPLKRFSKHLFAITKTSKTTVKPYLYSFLLPLSIIPFETLNFPINLRIFYGFSHEIEQIFSVEGWKQPNFQLTLMISQKKDP